MADGTNKPLEALLAELASKGVRLEVDGGELLVRAPREALTPVLKQALSENKPRLVALLKEGRGQTNVAPIVHDAGRRYEPFPLTDIQQAYWIGRDETLTLGGVGCHYYQEFERQGLNVGQLEVAFQRVVAHHDMLRSVVRQDGTQQILEHVPPYRFEVADLRGLGATAVEERIQAIRAEMEYRVFDPRAWPSFECRVTLLDGARVRTHLSVDLWMLDAESLSLLIRDWERAYGDPSALKPLELSFRDCVVAEQTRRDGEERKRALEYWRDRLPTLPLAPRLPGRRGGDRPSGGPGERRRLKGRLEATAWGELRARCARAGLTPSALLCSAFSEVLGVWSSSSSFTLNLTFCRRQPLHPRIDELLGDFTSTLLLEVERRTESFMERARLLQRRLSADMDHLSVSGIEVLRMLSQVRRGSISGIQAPIVFTSLIGHREAPAGVLFSGNWLGEVVHGISQTPQVALDHQGFEENGALVYHWDYVCDEFPPGMMEDMFAAYGVLLSGLSGQDAVWAARNPVPVPGETLQRRQAVNATGRSYPDRLLHEPFLERATEAPGRPAVISAERTLSYAELEARSRVLAHELVRRGASSGRLIAVVMEKGWEQVVGVLGVLRAGAAYLPIEADLPAARVRQLIESGGASIVLTQSRVHARFHWPDGVHGICVDALAEAPVEGEQPVLPRRSSSDLAYTLFTSGSTGQPKGVMIDHRGALNTIFDINERFGVGPGDRVLGLSALGFDLSVYDIFGVLAAGGALVLPEPSAARDPERWLKLMHEHGVTLWNSVPALMKLLVEFVRPRDGSPLKPLRLVLLSGDWLPVSLPDELRAAGARQVISLGGATEASIWSILFPIGEVDPRWPSIPYGQPMKNQSFEVLDEHMNPCPDWVPGELHIGGTGVALGYWGNEEETARRFVRHPGTGQRLYRTGDMGRYLPDGNIEILGRKDFQVKLQGYRIELGEIESVLAQHPLVSAAVVVVRELEREQKQLVAYVVPTSEASVGSVLESALRAHLEGCLPRYMVPTIFVTVASLPLTSNGKVDRTQLPAPVRVPEPCAEVSAVSRLAQTLMDITRDVLCVPRVRLDDRFVDLGCTSLHVVRIHQQLADRLPNVPSITELFNHPTLHSLAEYLEHRQEPAPSPPPARRERSQSARQEAIRRRKSAREENP